MPGLILDVPSGGGESFAWLLGRMQSAEPAFANDIITLRTGAGFALSLGDQRLAELMLGAPSEVFEVAPDLAVRPIAENDLVGFLESEWSALDHIGINLSHRDIDEARWTRLVAQLAAELPAWRLDVGSANDIVIVVAEEGGRASTVELVFDRRAERSSFHVCARVKADRTAVEAAFPAPFGAYKPGDEAFFRSVALPVSPRLSSYLDLAFSDAQMGPWPGIVAAMGKRIA